MNRDGLHTWCRDCNRIRMARLRAEQRAKREAERAPFNWENFAFPRRGGGSKGTKD